MSALLNRSQSASHTRSKAQQDAAFRGSPVPRLSLISAKDESRPRPPTAHVVSSSARKHPPPRPCTAPRPLTSRSTPTKKHGAPSSHAPLQARATRESASPATAGVQGRSVSAYDTARPRPGTVSEEMSGAREKQRLLFGLQPTPARMRPASTNARLGLNTDGASAVAGLTRAGSHTTSVHSDGMNSGRSSAQGASECQGRMTLEEQLDYLKQDDDNRLLRQAEEQERARQEHQRAEVRARLESAAAKFAHYSNLEAQEQGKRSQVLTLEGATAMLKDEGLLGEGEGCVQAQVVRAVVAAASPSRGRHGGTMLTAREFRRFIMLLCQHLHQPTEPCLQIAMSAEHQQAHHTATKGRPDPSGTDASLQRTASSMFARALSAQSSSSIPRTTKVQSAVAKLRFAVKIGGAIQQSAQQAEQQRSQAPQRRVNPLLTPAPHPGTYLGPFTLRWPHPASANAYFTVSDNYPLFRKHLRDREQYQQDDSNLRHYSAREQGPCHPTIHKGRQKKCWESAPAGYYRQAQGVGRFICTVCARAFINTAVLQSHYKTHTHLEALARSKLPPTPSTPSSASSVDLLAPSGRSTPSSLGQWDQSYDALDEIPTRGRHSVVGTRHPGQMEFWWQKVKVQLDKTLMAASDEELDDMVLSLLGVDLPYDSDYDDDHEDELAPAPRRRVAARLGAGKYLQVRKKGAVSTSG